MYQRKTELNRDSFRVFIEPGSFFVNNLDLQAKIPEFKACAVQVFPARNDELPNPDVVLERGRY
jgi:hypothetical protein